MSEVHINEAQNIYYGQLVIGGEWHRLILDKATDAVRYYDTNKSAFVEVSQADFYRLICLEDAISVVETHKQIGICPDCNPSRGTTGNGYDNIMSPYERQKKLLENTFCRSCGRKL